eukprot:5545347-Ditylum_brightwellii.AAC.1
MGTVLEGSWLMTDEVLQMMCCLVVVLSSCLVQTTSSLWYAPSWLLSNHHFHLSDVDVHIPRGWLSCPSAQRKIFLSWPIK